MNSKRKLVWKITAITLCCAIVAFGISMISSGFFAQSGKNIVIVLDPGHGGADTGAVNYTDGLYESDVNLDIALACRDELLRYDGVEVYMTHTGLAQNQTLSLGDRVDYANQVEADILISLHCNDADNPEATGSEVYVSHSTYSDRYNQDSTQLGICILKQFKNLGMTIRGVKIRISETGDRIYTHSDGSQEIGDYYAVIGSTIQKYGIPGILVEHAFITGDADMLGEAEGRRLLGVADATAIAQFYGLTLKGADADETPYEQLDAVLPATDTEILSASDVVNSLIKLPDELTTAHLERLQNIRLDYEKLTDVSKSLVDSDMIDRVYKSILQLDAQLHPVRLAASDNSEISVNRLDHTISGIDIATVSLSGTNVSALRSWMQIFIDTAYISGDYDTSVCRIVITDAEGSEMDIGATVGTGTTVQLWANDQLLDELYAVIPGDISGDGAINSLDQLLLEEHLNNSAIINAADYTAEEGVSYPTLGGAALLAADINGDSRVNQKDLEQLVFLIAENN